MHVWFLPSLIPAGILRSAGVVVIDLLRASTTITRALDHGAARVIPCLEPEEALETRARLIGSGQAQDRIVLGGERGGVLIPGFDLDNSPAKYTRHAVAGRTVVFTTTNGTRALLAARDGGASRVVIGCLNNLSTVVNRVDGFDAVHLVCAGTRGEVSQEDVACAGAMAEILVARRREPGSDDQTRIAMACWAGAGTPDARLSLLRASRGGRNLIRIGFDADITDCARVDTTRLVSELGADGALRPVAEEQS